MDLSVPYSGKWPNDAWLPDCTAEKPAAKSAGARDPEEIRIQCSVCDPFGFLLQGLPAPPGGETADDGRPICVRCYTKQQTAKPATKPAAKPVHGKRQREGEHVCCYCKKGEGKKGESWMEMKQCPYKLGEAHPQCTSWYHLFCRQMYENAHGGRGLGSERCQHH